MTHKNIALKIVLPATLAIALGLVAWFGAGRHIGPIDQAIASRSVAAGPEISELPNPGLSRVRLLISNLN